MTSWLAASAAERRLLPDARVAGPMPWIVAVMSFLMVAAAGGGLAVRKTAHELDAAVRNQLSVQIVEPSPVRRMQVRGRVIAALRLRPEIAALTLVPEAELREQLAPWLGSIGDEDDLPIPVLIDVQLEGERGSDRLSDAIRGIDASVRVTPHAQFLQPLVAVLTTLRWLASAIVVLVASATAFAVVLAVRAALNTHRATIDVMHLMGATDRDIAWLFQRRVAIDAAIGAGAGLILGSGVLVLLGRQLAAVDAAVVGQGGLSALDWAGIAFVPLAVVLISVFAARRTVLTALARML